jgi:hypothetical protein
VLGIYKAYPAIEKYRTEKKYEGHPSIEIYTPTEIIYGMEIPQQQ